MSDLYKEASETFPEICIEPPHTHIRNEPIALHEFIALYLLPRKIGSGIMARGTIRRHAKREAGLPVIRKEVLYKRRMLYTNLAKTSFVVFYVVAPIVSLILFLR